jgi:hypothetical protein
MSGDVSSSPCNNKSEYSGFSESHEYPDFSFKMIAAYC